MTFLNPLVLFGLVAASIPILLHLLNLRKLRTVEFSTLTFLKELQQTKIRRLKLRQILLLIIRTLLVIAIIIAFARPVIRGTILGNIGSHAHSSVVFIWDDSFSMSASDEHGQRFKQAKDAIAKLVAMLKDGDESFLIKLSDLPKASIETPTHDAAALMNVINESEISPVRRTLDDALKVAAKLLSQSSNATMIHVRTFGEKFMKRFMSVMTPTRQMVYGNPNAMVKEALSKVGARFMVPADGFIR